MLGAAAWTQGHTQCPGAAGCWAEAAGICGHMPRGLSGLPSGLRGSGSSNLEGANLQASEQGGLQARVAGGGLGKEWA